MDNDNKMLILAVVVVVALGFLGFVFGDLTGYSTRDSNEKTLTRLYISSNPDIIEEFSPTIGASDFVYFTVEVGSAGVNDQISFYEVDGLNERRRSQTHIECTGYICRPNRVEVKKYKIPSSWEGEYCAKVYDREFAEDVKTCFFVE